MLRSFTLSTAHEGFVNITGRISEILSESGVKSGICLVYCPHTTAGITINENADPDVTADLLKGLAKVSPDRPEYRHFEGNSHAHLKTLVTGSSVCVIIEDGRLLLGRWQGIYFAEYDGPRTRTVHVKIISD
ncbi:MAG: secondary thiamine-phosphate synthase enzyme YjbQ [Huintestinicola sp.]